LKRHRASSGQKTTRLHSGELRRDRPVFALTSYASAGDSGRKKTGSGGPFQNLFDIIMNFLKNGKKLSPSNLNLLIVIRLWEYNL